jgi:hypothetical protein
MRFRRNGSRTIYTHRGLGSEILKPIVVQLAINKSTTTSADGEVYRLYLGPMSAPDKLSRE